MVPAKCGILTVVLEITRSTWGSVCGFFRVWLLFGPWGFAKASALVLAVESVHPSVGAVGV